MAAGTFDTWLVDKLNSLSLDEEVYCDYLKSVLDESESTEELRETLIDILSGVLEENIEETADEIIEIWNQNKKAATTDTNGTQPDGRDDSIKALMEQKTLEQQTKFASKKNKQVDHELKSKLIAQYGEVSDGEEGDESSDDDPPTDFVNVNAKMVTDKIQQEREKSKKDFEEKKQRDKMNLAKDKSKKEDRKDKEKNRTQKGERRAR